MAKRNDKKQDPEIEDNADNSDLETAYNVNRNKLSFIERGLVEVHSDEEEPINTIGEVPLKWYDEYDHIGYTLTGDQVVKADVNGTPDNISMLLDRENDQHWRKIWDEKNQREIVLTDEELGILRRIQNAKYGDPDVNPDELYLGPIEVEVQPAINIPEPKRRFVPSKWEAQKIAYLVKSIRKGWIKLDEPKSVRRDFPNYAIWNEEEEAALSKRQMQYIPAPKLRLPGHNESYHPPKEYLFSEEEKKKWESLDPDERAMKFMPQSYDRLRHCPAYEKLIKERFNRCLDLYLCPRTVVKKKKVDPQSLLPDLPSPNDLRPFPTTLCVAFSGHSDKIRTISPDPTGQWLASGSDDCKVKIWEVNTGRCMKEWKFENPVRSVSWNPSLEFSILAVGTGKDLFLIDIDLFGTEASESRARSNELLTVKPDVAHSLLKWSLTKESALSDHGVKLQITHARSIEQIQWHYKGDYFAVVCPGSHHQQVIIHKLSNHQSQNPFAKIKGEVQCVSFHPLKPFFLVATQKNIRIYNLANQVLMKKLTGTMDCISSISVHPRGDNILMGSYDSKVCWYDLDWGSKPYRTMKYHKESVRGVQYHSKFPLFASISDDTKAHVFHGMVYDDLLKNALIVPLKILKGHTLVKGLGIMALAWHPHLPWLFTAGADGKILLYSQ